MPTPYRFHALLALLVVWNVGCGDGGGGTPPPEADELVITSGNHQTGATGAVLADSLRVQVLGSGGSPLQGATVQWSVTQGQATVSPTQSTTDANGSAATEVTLGPTPGAVVVSATVENLAPAAFSITALEVSAFISVTAGFEHTCGITAAGDAYCWGSNSFGKLGDGSEPTEVRPRPVLVLGGLSWTSLSAGGQGTCGLSTTGEAYCWGFAAVSPTEHASAPVPVPGGLVFTKVSAAGGAQHRCALTSTGAAYCWGDNESGQLGDGTTTPQTSPVPVRGDLSFVDLGTGNSYTCGLTAGGAVYCWGNNSSGQLGDGTRTNRLTPVQVGGGLSFGALGVSASNACAITTAGAAYCWGLNSEAELGIGTTDGPERCLLGNYPCSTSPLPVVGGLTFTKLSGGVTNSHNCAMTAAGAAYCWGYNPGGQLGDGTTAGNETCYPTGPEGPGFPCSTVPVRVVGGLTFSSLTAGSLHTCGLTVGGQVYCWGSNHAGQLGDGSTTQRSTPVPILIQ
jgi:alpha-tubulin suppressor-like RCC1 family protein